MMDDKAYMKLQYLPTFAFPLKYVPSQCKVAEDFKTVQDYITSTCLISHKSFKSVQEIVAYVLKANSIRIKLVAKSPV